VSTFHVPPSQNRAATFSGPQLDHLISRWTEQGGSNLNGYKRPFLSRRISTRIGQLQLGNLADYARYVDQDPKELILLVQTLLIRCTKFFRDPLLWNHIATTIIPALLALKAAEEPIRIWAPGCASGEESYSLAMLLADAMGTDVFRQRVRFYATDLDEHALRKARCGHYDAQDLQFIDKGLLDKYFSHRPDGFHIHKELRAGIVFARHNLLQDAPFHHIDLIMCRNTFIYFGRETQAWLLARFHRALEEQGCLVLGQSESPANNRTFGASTKADGEVHIYSKTLPGSPAAGGDVLIDLSKFEASVFGEPIA
jgi:two-component system CheB/CheR fusion protein